MSDTPFIDSAIREFHEREKRRVDEATKSNPLEERVEWMELEIERLTEARRVHLIRLDKLTRQIEDEVPPFTRQDVDLLRDACVIDFFDGGGVDTDPDADEVLSSLADRIEALLPPEEK